MRLFGLQQKQRCADERPLIRGALDPEVFANQLHAFAHSIHTETPARVRHAGIEPAAIVRNLDLKLPRATAYRDSLIAAATVAKFFGQRFLKQTELTAKELATEIQPMECAKKKTKNMGPRPSTSSTTSSRYARWSRPRKEGESIRRRSQVGSRRWTTEK